MKHRGVRGVMYCCAGLAVESQIVVEGSEAGLGSRRVSGCLRDMTGRTKGSSLRGKAGGLGGTRMSGELWPQIDRW